MLSNDRRGFAVMTEDLTAYSFESENYSDCLRYCTHGDVIVEMIPKKCGFKLRFQWTINYGQWLKYDKYSNRIDIGRLHIWWGAEWWHVKGNVVYKNEEK